MAGSTSGQKLAGEINFSGGVKQDKYGDLARLGWLEMAGGKIAGISANGYEDVT